MHTAKAETRLGRLIYSGLHFANSVLTQSLLNCGSFFYESGRFDDMVGILFLIKDWNGTVKHCIR